MAEIDVVQLMAQHQGKLLFGQLCLEVHRIPHDKASGQPGGDPRPDLSGLHPELQPVGPQGHQLLLLQLARVKSPISASIEFSGHMPAQFFPSGDAKYKKSRRPEAPRRRNLRGNFAGGCRDSSDFLLPLRKIRLLIHSQHHHGIRRNSLQNNARDKRNVGTRRMAASGRKQKT